MPYGTKTARVLKLNCMVIIKERNIESSVQNAVVEIPKTPPRFHKLLTKLLCSDVNSAYLQGNHSRGHRLKRIKFPQFLQEINSCILI